MIDAKYQMSKVIGVIQVKGGAGRSTVSTNLAGALSKLVNAELRQEREPTAPN